jgi:DNA invertase Pin-like site-specific DNA recombinase
VIAAIYARKSTEQDVSDEQKSVTRQVEHARAYAARKGWTVAEDHVYVDDGVSGAEFKQRPGLIRLLAALEPRPPFQVLIMSEESRLGRENIQTGWILKQVIDSEVRVFYYLEDSERTLDNAIEKIMMQLTSFAAEMEREKASQRVYDAAIRRVRAGQVAGAKIFGYDNVPILGAEPGRDGQPKRLYTLRKINPDQARVVHRIFTMYSQGYGMSTIAHRLNADHVPSPRQQGWAQAGVKHMLRNELYKGVVIWGRVQNVVRKGTMRHRARPAAEQIRLAAPELQIITDKLWGEVQGRFAQQARRLVRGPEGRLLSRPTWRDGHSDYLLPGFVQCALCGGAIRTFHEKHGAARRRVVRKYGCAIRDVRGAATCANHVKLQQQILDRAILDALHELLDESMIVAAVDRALATLRAGQAGQLDRRTQITRELSLLEHRKERLWDEYLNSAVPITAPPMRELKTKIEVEAIRKDVLARELEQLDRLTALACLDGPRLARALTRQATHLQALLGREIPQARQLLRKLLAGAIRCTPVQVDGRWGYRFEGDLVYGRLLTGEARVEAGLGNLPDVGETPSGSSAG